MKPFDVQVPWQVGERRLYLTGRVTLRHGAPSSVRDFECRDLRTDERVTLSDAALEDAQNQLVAETIALWGRP